MDWVTGSYRFSRVFWVLFFCLMVSVPAHSASKPVRSGWRKTCKIALVALTLTTAGIVFPSTYHSFRAALKGEKHIGHGIYLNMSTVLTKLTPEERKLVSEADTHPEEVVQLFIDKLNGDYGNWVFLPIAPSSQATDYFVGAGKDRGVCRHKACILAAVLNHVGVRAELQCGAPLSSPYAWHVWVYLPDTDKIADPTNGSFKPRLDYEGDYDIRLTQVPMPSGVY